MRGRVGVGRSVEIVAERSAERGLEASRDGDRIHHRRPSPAGGGAQQVRQRPGLGFQALGLAFGLVQRPARGRLGVARPRMRRLRGERLLLGFGEIVAQRFQRGFGFRKAASSSPTPGSAPRSRSSPASSFSNRDSRRVSSDQRRPRARGGAR